ncbi:uncharacterized protein LOC143290640 [Babylonia areolata]|uniref:uncharacterized protein LOC143290640 n=1 Tax=Babylonia areolata TaxID=304850 RepID=UPI003FD243C5
MFRLGGLRSDLQNQGAMAIAVALTHNSVYDHSDEVMALDMCPTIRMFLTCSNDGFVKIWDSDNQLVREMNFGHAIHGACFANNRGDILVGLHNRIIMIPMTSYLPLDQLERMAQKIFKDDESEKPIPYKPNKNRRKHWFDRKHLPKFSTDLQKRISEKVQMHSEIFSEMMESESSLLERVNTAMSVTTEASALDDQEGDFEQFSTAREAEAFLPPAAGKSAVASKVSEKRPMEMSRARRKTRGSISLRRRSMIEELKEEEEEPLPPLERKPSLANIRKRSSLASLGLTARVIKDLELAAKRKRLSIVSTMPTAPAAPPVDEKEKREEEEKALAFKKEMEAREAENVKKLPAWEQFLLKKKPIIALDGYIPNSVVRATIGFTKPKSPEPAWRLKPVPKVNPKHLPEGWKLLRESSVLAKDADIKSLMSMKRESTLQNLKQQQSIKDASMYIGTIYCLLPDGTEPESVPNFTWDTPKDELTDLSAPIRNKTVTSAMKQATVITAVPQKPQQQKKDTSVTPQNAAHKSTRKLAQKNVSIDLSANMDMRIASRPKPVMEVPAPKKEKSLSFRLPTAGSASATLMEDSAAEEKEQAEVGAAVDGEIVDGCSKGPESQEDHPRGISAAGGQQEERTRKGSQHDGKEASFDRTQTQSQGKKSGHLRTPGKSGTYRRELTEQELGLLQRIVKEEWFPLGVAPALEPVMDALLAFVDRGEVAHYNKVCDYIVAIAREIGMPQRYMNKCGDKLTKQTSHVAALIRKKSLWTLRQLGISRKDLLSAILPGLSDTKEDIREEAIEALNEMMGEQGQEGLVNLMSSLGISRPLNTKEDRQGALKAISEKLVSDKKNKGGGDTRERIQMWVSSLSTNDPTSSYDSKATETQKMSSRWDTMTPGASRGSVATLSMSEFDPDTPGEREDTLRSKSERDLKSSRHKSSVSRKSTGKLSAGESDGPLNQARGVEQGTEMSPLLTKDGVKARRGKEEHKGGLQGSMRAEDEYLFKRYEHYGSEYSEEEDIYADRAQFVAIDYDLTPNMFRSETGDSWLSDDILPLNRTEQSSRRPKGASVQKFYTRQEQVSSTGTDAGGGLRSRRRWQGRQGKAGDEYYYDSDIHSTSQYDTDLDGGEGGTHRTVDGGTDIASMADSGIVPDASETSSNMRSLYKQGQPGLSTITSTSQMAGEGAREGAGEGAEAGAGAGEKPKKKGESDWREFFETSTAIQRKRAEQAKKEKEAGGKEGKVVFTTNLPPITYINSDQPTTTGEAGLRCLHTIRVAEKDKNDTEKHKIDSVPARLSIHTQDESEGETNYGLLQMTWTTNVPALPIMPETRGEPLIPKDIMQPWNHTPLPRLMQPGLWTKQNAESLMDELQKKLPTLRSDRSQDFQWKRPLPRAKMASQDPVSERPERHQCESLRLAKKKMHHFTSARSQRLPKVDEQSLKSEAPSHLLSMIRQSSMSFLPPAPLQNVLRHISANPEIDAT